MMDTAAKQREHYKQVKARLNAPSSIIDPEAPYLRGNRKLHPVLDNQLGDPPVELAPHEVRSRAHKIRTKALLHKTRKAAKATQAAARKRRQEITRPYDEWEAMDASADKPTSDDGSNGGNRPHDDASCAKGFAPKASAQGFQQWLAQRRGQQDSANTGCIANNDDKTTAQADAAQAGQADQQVMTLPPLEYVQQICDAADASRDQKIVE
jgi:hypothetical protein